jgi:hypothetical protein
MLLDEALLQLLTFHRIKKSGIEKEILDFTERYFDNRIILAVSKRVVTRKKSQKIGSTKKNINAIRILGC